jgi:SPP1 family predicted phage head-tail adaptor
MRNAGELDTKIVIKEMTLAKDDWNTDVKTLSDFATVWAKRIDLRPSEEVEASSLEAITRTEWYIRFLSGVTRTMEIHYDGAVWDIIGIQEKGRNDYLILTTEMRERT